MKSSHSSVMNTYSGQHVMLLNYIRMTNPQEKAIPLKKKVVCFILQYCKIMFQKVVTYHMLCIVDTSSLLFSLSYYRRKSLNLQVKKKNKHKHNIEVCWSTKWRHRWECKLKPTIKNEVYQYRFIRKFGKMFCNLEPRLIMYQENKNNYVVFCYKNFKVN